MFTLPGMIGTLGPVASTSYIVSIQPVSITIGNGQTSNTAIISSVNTSNAVLFYQGQSNSASSTDDIGQARITLTNGTTVTALRNTSSTKTITVRAAVIEFSSSAIQSVQYGTVSVANTSNTANATISSVNTSNSSVIYLGISSDSNSNQSPANNEFLLSITGATTVAATRNNGTNTGNCVISFCVVEYKAAVLQSLQTVNFSVFTANTSDTFTISSVNTANTVLIWGGQRTPQPSENSAYLNVQLTNSTTLTFTRGGGTAGGIRAATISVVEFASGVMKSMQRGTISLGSGQTSNTATISSVGTSKSFVNYCDFNNNGASGGSEDFSQIFPTLALTNSTTVTAARGATSTSTTVASYEVPEFN